MEHFVLSTAEKDPVFAQAAAERLARGQVAVLPTETVYGIMCNADLPAAAERIVQMKGRDPSKKCQLLIPNLDSVVARLVADPRLALLSHAFWPGPLTVVADDLSGNTLGIRVPAQQLVLDILECFDGPLMASSANLSGTAAETYDDACRQLNYQPDFGVDGGIRSGQASTVLRLERNATWHLLREGALTREEIELVLTQASQ